MSTCLNRKTQENRESKSVEEPSADAAAENKVESAASENE